jgi:hypothetical protein
MLRCDPNSCDLGPLGAIVFPGVVKPGVRGRPRDIPSKQHRDMAVCVVRHGMPPARAGRTYIGALHPLHAVLGIARQGQRPENEGNPSCRERPQTPNTEAVPQRPFHIVMGRKRPLRLQGLFLFQ